MDRPFDRAKMMLQKLVHKGSGLRRCMRFTFLFAIVAVLAIVMYTFIVLTYSRKTGSFTSDYDVIIKQTNCKLFLVNTTDTGKVGIKSEIPGTSLTIKTNEAAKTITIETHSTSNFTDACYARLYIPENYPIKSLTYTCKGNCYIIHSYPSTLTFTENLKITGGNVSANFQTVKANYLEITSNKGDITVHNGIMATGAKLETEEGTVVFQATTAFRVNINNQNNLYFCLGAAFYSNDGPAITVASTGNSLSVAMCPTFPCFYASVVTPAISIKANFGNAYANLITAESEPMPLTTVPYIDTALTIVNKGAFSMDERTKTLYEKAYKIYNLTTKADSLMMFDIGNYLGKASSAIKMVATPSEAYLNAKPWWISFFSLTLLIGSKLQIPTRLVPGFCPYRPLPTLYDIYNVQQYLQLLMRGDSKFADDFGVIYAVAYDELLNDTYQKSTGYTPESANFDVYGITKNKQGVALKSRNSMYDQPSLSAAVIISVILASFIGVAGMIILIIAMRKLFESLGAESVHIRKYTNLSMITKSYRKQKELNILEDTAFLEEFKKTTQAPEKESSLKSESSIFQSVATGEKSPLMSSTVSGDNPQKDYGKVSAKLVKKSNMFSILKKLPNQFSILDHLVFIFNRYISNSVEEFAHYLYEPCNENEPYSEEQVSMEVIKTLYEKYCFLSNYPEVDILGSENAKFFKKYGYKINKREDPTTEVFRKIRFRGEEEIKQAKNEMNELSDANKSEDSLAEFIKSFCQTTDFEEDYIACEEFIAEYEKFCVESRRATKPVTRSLMQETQNIEASNLVVSFLERDPDYLTVVEKDELNNRATKAQNRKKIKVKKRFKVNLKQMKKIIDGTLALHSPDDEFYEKHKKPPLTFGWFFIDFISVVFHFIFIIFMALPLFGIPYFFELSLGEYSTADYQKTIATSDWLYAQWNIFFKIKYAQLASIILMIISGVYVFISIIDLFSYYISMKFPICTLRIFAKINDDSNTSKPLTCGSFMRGLINGIEWIYIFIAVGLILLYLMLVLEWSILGAVLNPTAYLAYAASAGTFIAFVSTKFNQFKNLQKMGIEGIKELLWKEVSKGMMNIMQKYMKKFGFDTTKLPTDPANSSNRMDSMLDMLLLFISNTPIGKKMASQGFDILQIKLIIEGDEVAIDKFANSKGFPPAIIKIVQSTVVGNFDAVDKHIVELANGPPFKLPKEITQMVLNIVHRHTEANIPKIIAEIGLVFINFLESKIKIKSPYFSLVKSVFPQAINAIVCLKRNDIDGFLDQLKIMNESVIDMFTKKAQYETDTGKGEECKGMFTKNGDVAFAIPNIFFNIIEIAKVLVCNKSESGVKFKFARIRPAVFKLVQIITGIDKTIIDFLSIVFSATAEKLMSSDNTDTILMKSEIRDVAIKMSKILNIKPFFIKLFFKFLFMDKAIDDELINELFSEITSKFPNVEELKFLNADLFRNIIRLYTLIKSRDPAKYLLNQCSQFKVDKDEAEALIVLATGNEFIKNGLSNVMTSNLVGEFSRALLISKKEVSGFISILMGNFDLPEVTVLLQSILERNKLPFIMLNFMLSLLKIIVSRNTDELLQAGRNIKIQDTIWILIGKKLMQPKDIDPNEFVKLCIPPKSPIIEALPNVTIDDPANFTLWMNELLKELNSSLTPDGQSAFMEYFEKLRMQENPNLSAILNPNGNKTEISSIKVMPQELIEKIKAKRQLILKLLVIETVQLSSNLIEKFIVNYNDNANKDEPLILIKGVQREAVDKFFQIKNIIKRESRNAIINASKDFCMIMKLEEELVLAIVTIVTSTNQQEIKEAMKAVFRQVSNDDPKAGGDNLLNYGKFMAEEITAVKDAQNAVTYFSKLLHVPEFILRKFLVPYDTSTRINLADVQMMLDLVGFSKLLATHPISIKGFNGKVTKLGVNEFKLLLSSIAIGHANDFELALDLFGIPATLKGVIQAILSPNAPTIIRVIQEKLKPIFTTIDVPPKLIDLLLGLIALLSGNATECKFKLENYSIPVDTIELLSSMLKLKPEVFRIIDILIFKKGNDKLIEPITSLLANNVTLPQYIIKGFASLALGSAIELENFSIALGVKLELLEVLLHFTLLKKDKDVPMNLDKLRVMGSFGTFCRMLKVNTDIMMLLLKLSFNLISFNDVFNVLQTLKIAEIVDKEFICALISIAKGYNAINIYFKKSVSIDNPTRIAISNEISEKCTPIFHKFGLDPELSLITLSLRQGDFQVIEDKGDYLTPLLPTPVIRKLTAGLVGLFTHPIQFKNKIGNYPDIESDNITLSFEGANTLLCTVLNMNPAVLRLVSFDKEIYDYIQKQYRFPKGPLASLIMSLGNPNFNVTTSLIIRSFFRSARVLVDELKNCKDEFISGKRKAKKDAEEDDEKKEEEPKKEEGKKEEKKEDAPKDEVKKEEAKKEDAPKEEIKKEDAPKEEVKKEEAPKEEIKKEEAPKEEIKKEEAPKEEVKKEEAKKEEPKEKPFTKFDNYFDRKNYNEMKEFDKIINQGNPVVYSHPFIDLDEDYFEVAMFNDPAMMCYDHTKLIDQKKRHYNFEDEKLKRILGTKEEFEKQFLNCFYEDSHDPKLSFVDPKGEKSMSLNADNSWLNKEYRKNARNIWERFQRLLRDIAMDTKITGDKQSKYDRVNIAQLEFYIFILTAKYKIESADWEMTEEAYRILMGDIDNVLVALEILGFLGGKLDLKFDRVRVMKFVSLATGIKISNKIDYKFMTSMYTPAVYIDMRDMFSDLKRVEEVLGKLSKIKDTMRSASILVYSDQYNNIEQYCATYDHLDENNIYSDINPYSHETVRNWRPSEYPVFKYNTAIKAIELDRNKKVGMPQLRTNLMVKPLSIKIKTEKEIKENALDLSAQPVNSVIELLTKVEQLVVADDGFEFISDLARCNVSVFDKYKESLKAQDIIKTKDSCMIYKGLFKLLCMPKISADIANLIKQGVKINTSDESIRELCCFFGNTVGKVDSQMAEDVLMLSHGNIEPVYLIGIAGKFGVAGDLLEALLFNGKQDKKKILDSIEIIIKELISRRVQFDPEPIFSIISIFKGDFMGVRKIIDSLNFPYKKFIIKVLDTVNWAKLSTIKANEMLSVSIKDVINPEKIDQLMKALIDVGSQFAEEMAVDGNIQKITKEALVIFENVMSLVFKIFNKDIATIGEPLLKLMHLFNINEKIIEVLEAFIIFLNNDPDINIKDKIVIAVEKISDVILSVLNIEGPDAKEFISKIIGFLNCILGGVYKDYKLFCKGVSEISSNLKIVLKIAQGMRCFFKLNHKNAQLFLRSGCKESIDMLKTLSLLIVIIINQIKQLSMKQKQYVSDSVNNKTQGKTKSFLDKIKESPISTINSMDDIITTFFQPLNEILATIGELDKTKIEEILEHPEDFKYLHSKEWLEKITTEVLIPVLKAVGISGGDINLISNFISLLISLICADFRSVGYNIANLFAGTFKSVNTMLEGFSRLLAYDLAKFEKDLVGANPPLLELVAKLTESFISILDEAVNQQLAKVLKADSPAMVALNKVKNFMKDNKKFLEPIFVLFEAIKLGAMMQGYMIKYIMQVIKSIIDKEVDNPIIKKITSLIIGIIGYNIDSPNEEPPTIEKRISFVIESVVNIFFPDLVPIARMITNLINLVGGLFRGSITAMQAIETAMQIAMMFGLSPQIVQGIMGIIKGDFDAIITFIGPIAKVDPAKLKLFVDILKEAKRIITEFMKKRGSTIKKVDQSLLTDAWKEMLKKIREGTAGVKELFDMVDNDGDRSGSISKVEFGALLSKLQIEASEHRVDEIYAKCKKEGDNKDPSNDLNVDEFSVALDYVQDKSTGDGLNLLDISTSQLIILFSIIAIVLIMLICFILLGINAFTAGGIFNSIINSMMPMLGGVGMSRKNPGGNNKVNLMDKIKAMLPKIQGIMGKKK